MQQHLGITWALALALLGTALWALPAHPQQSCGDAASVEDTTWDTTDSTGQKEAYEFQKGGSLVQYTPNGRFPNGTWKQNGGCLSFEVNKGYVTFEARIEGNRFEGKAQPRFGEGWTLTGTRRSGKKSGSAPRPAPSAGPEDGFSITTDRTGQVIAVNDAPVGNGAPAPKSRREREDHASKVVQLHPPKSSEALPAARNAQADRPELVVQMGHRTGLGGGVQVMTLNPDGRLLASGGGVFDGTIRLWDTRTWLLVRTIPNAGRVHGLAFHSQGQFIASTSHDPLNVSLWDAHTGLLLKRWPLARGAFGQETLGFGFSPDGKRLAVRRIAASDAPVETFVWEITSGREWKGSCDWCASLPEPSSRVRSRDGLWEARGFDGRSTIDVIHFGSGDERKVGGDVTYNESLSFSPDGRWLALGGGLAYHNGDGAVRLWDLRTGELMHQSGKLGVYGVSKPSFTADGRWLAFVARGSGPSLDTLHVWQPVSAQPLYSYETSVGAAALSPKDDWIAFHSERGNQDDLNVQAWRFTEAANRPVVWASRSQGNSMEFSPDGRWLAEGTSIGLGIWDVPAKKLERISKVARGLAFSSDGNLLAVANDNELAVLETGTWKQRFSVPTVSTIDRWDLRGEVQADGKLVLTPKGDSLRVPLAFSPDGRWLATTGYADIKLLDASSGRLVRALLNHMDDVMDVAFSPDGRWLASSSVDGSVRIWEVSSGREVALLAMMRETGDWLAATPDGLFDGSPGALRGLAAWRFSDNQTAPLELFFNEFYRPGLLAEVLLGKPLQAPRDFAQLDRRQPDVKLAVGAGQPATGPVVSRTVPLKLEIAEAPADASRPTGSGARDVRLFRNGSLVKVWRGDVLKGQKQIALEASVPIVAGPNRFTAYAFNKDNIKSSDAELVVAGAESLRRKGTAYVLAIGINQYANKEYNLSYAVADAQVFAEELARQQTKLGEYAKVEVIPLLDKDATKSNLLAALKRLAGETQNSPSAKTPPPLAALAKLQPAQPEDAVFVYYAGHGTASGPRFYLIPHDLGYTGSRTEIDEAGLKAILDHSISDRDLEQAFEKIDAGRLLLVIDACNSGQALEAEEKRRGPMNSKGLAQLAYEKGMYVLTAAQGYQAALEAAQLGHGYLTYALVEEGLKTPSADSSPKDGSVVVREWLDYATLRVPQMQEQGMQDARKLGRNLAIVEGEEKVEDLAQRSLQRPRVFYRREPEAQPLVVAKP